MGSARTPKAKVATAPDSATAPGERSAKALLDGATEPYEVAAIIHLNPRHEDALLEHLIETCADTYYNEVLLQLAWIEQHWGAAPTDHTQVAGRDALAGARGGAPTVRSVPDPAERLPYDGAGWDGLAINLHLGQHDRLTGTDSDGARCSFATAMAGQILRGPSALARWLVAYLNDHAPAEAAVTPRQRGARDVVVAVADAVGAGTASYGDLSWAQEALHAFVKTDEGGGTGDAREVVADSVETFSALGKVVTSTADVLAAATTLSDGGRLMIALWGVRAAGGDDYVHQLAIMKHAGALYLYDPEWFTGEHLALASTTTLDRYTDPRVFSSVAFTLQGTVAPKGKGKAG